MDYYQSEYENMAPPMHIPVDYKAAWLGGYLPNDEPLLQEIGVNFGHIQAKTIAVLNPFKQVDSHLMDDSDLAGPLLFALLFGALLLVNGKLQFSYVYGFAAIGCFLMYAVMNLMSNNGVSLSVTASVLGYCLLPMVLLSLIHLVYTNLILSSLAIIWCTVASGNIFTGVLQMHHMRFLIMYPLFLLYAIFGLIAIF